MKHSAKPISMRDRISIPYLYSTYIYDFPRNYRFKGERHNFWELGYVLRGNVGITSDDKVYKCKEGDLIIHPPNYFHTCWGINRAQFSFFTISFSLNNLDNILPAHKISLSPENRIVIHALMDATKDCFSQTQGEFYYTRDEDNLLQYSSRRYQIVKNYLEILCLRLMKDDSAQDESAVSEDTLKYNQIVNCLKNGVCRNLSIEDIAKEVFESPANLKRIFHKYTNMGIIKYYNDLRAEYAVSLIGQGYSMGYIAKIMNFSSQNYFSYFFKRITGQSPSRYNRER